MSKRLKPIPKFANEATERAFWETPQNDSTEYVDWSKAKVTVFPKLKPSTEGASGFQTPTSPGAPSNRSLRRAGALDPKEPS
jgi:hypothetical protein